MTSQHTYTQPSHTHQSFYKNNLKINKYIKRKTPREIMCSMSAFHS